MDPLAIVAHPDEHVDGERSEDFGDSAVLVTEEARDLEQHLAVGDAPQPPGDDRFPVVADAAGIDHPAHRGQQRFE